MGKRLEELSEYIDNLDIIDTHEHLPAFEQDRDPDADILSEYLMHYYSRDLVSAGLSQRDLRRAVDVSLPIGDRWRLIEPYWEFSRYTAYCRALDTAVRDLYGIDRLSGDTIEQADALFQASKKTGTFKTVLREKCKIRKSILNTSCEQWDHELYAVSYTIDAMISPKSPADITAISEKTGITITCLEDWTAAVSKQLDLMREKGIVSVKCSLAYERPLSFPRATLHEAESGFGELLGRMFVPEWGSYSFTPQPHFQNYMMHFLLRYCGINRLPVQIHTGYHDGNHNIMTNSDVSMLIPLFAEYPDTRFDLFHISYPYQHFTAALAKTFPNVYLDMCWAHILSPSVCIRTLEEWIDTVPLNKISAFGGDYLFVDGVYGNVVMTRRNVAKVLSDKVDEGLFGMEEARWAAKLFLHDNPAELFKR